MNSDDIMLYLLITVAALSCAAIAFVIYDFFTGE